MQKFLSLISSLFFFFKFPLLWEVGYRGSCCCLCQRVFCMLYSKHFIVFGLSFRSLMHFEFIFVYGVRKCSIFILLQVVDQFSQHHLLKRLSFPQWTFLPSLSKIRYPQVLVFISGLSILFHWSIFLSLWQYHTVLMIIALSYSLKSGKLILPVPLFFLKIALDIWVFCVFPYKLWNYLF